MPPTWAFRWFSEICALALGVGLLWCHSEVRRAHERIDGLLKAVAMSPVSQTNIQQNTQQRTFDDNVRDVLKKMGKVE